MGKRYYWLKLHKDFFNSVRIKKLRSIAGGDTFTIIYLKLLLHALDNDGVIEYQGVENTISEELSLILAEDAENIGLCLSYLQSVGLAEVQNNNLFLPETVENSGSETASTQRWRDWKNRQSVEKVLDSNKIPTLCQQNPTSFQQVANKIQQNANVEIEIEKEIDKRREDNKKIIALSDTEPIVLNDGSEYRLPQELYDQYLKLYPAVNVKDEIRAMAAWCLNNPQKRKTKSGISRFIGSWLSKSQDRGGSSGYRPSYNNKKDVLPQYYNADPNRHEPVEKATPEEIAEAQEILKNLGRNKQK